ARSANNQQQSFWNQVDRLAQESKLPPSPAEDDEDELFDEAVKVVRSLNKASISLLQRRLRIGYTRAARLIDMMEARGIIDEADSSSKPRSVLKHEDD
ncbi:MAG: DNA translocase FtsK, partial [Anaerolineae bacterium]|nr:DNA translocase FtsK [Anaerolineae bacterium]